MQVAINLLNRLTTHKKYARALKVAFTFKKHIMR